MKKSIILVLVMSILMSLIPMSTYAANPVLFRVEITAEPNLRVRDEAGTHGTNRIGNLSYGEQVDVFGEVYVSGELWYEINFQGGIGFIYAAYTKKLTSDEVIQQPDPTDETPDPVDPVDPQVNLEGLKEHITKHYDEILTLSKYEPKEPDPVDEEDEEEEKEPSPVLENTISLYHKGTVLPVFVEIFVRPGGASMGYVHQGESYEILSKTTDTEGIEWYRIDVDDMSAYVLAQHLRVVTPEPKASEEGTYALVETDVLNVRDAASQSASRIGSVSINTKHRIVKETLNQEGELWYEIEYGNRTGFIASWYVSKRVEKTHYEVVPISSSNLPSKSRYSASIEGGDYRRVDSGAVIIQAESTGFKNPLYRFTYSKQGYFTTLRDFSTGSRLETTLPAGTYKVHVEVREEGAMDIHQVVADQHLVVGSNQVGLYSDSTNRHYMNSSIHLVAKSSSASPQYQFSVNAGNGFAILQRYSSSPYYKYEPSVKGSMVFRVEMKLPNGQVYTDEQTILLRPLSDDISFRDLSGSTKNHYRGRNGWVPDMVVSHITEGEYSGAVSWLQNPASQASSNFVIARDGRVTQLVDLRHGAWTNGTSMNPSSNSYNGKSKSAMVRQRGDNANYYTMTIENEGVYAQTKGAITERQFESTVHILEFMRNEVYRIYGRYLPFNTDRFTSHDVITPGTRSNDPGELYPFEELIDAVSP